MGIGLFARNEAGIERVREALEGIGVTVKRAVKRRWPFGRRWFVVARAEPLPIKHWAVDPWLDRVEALLAEQDAELVSWVPLV